MEELVHNPYMLSGKDHKTVLTFLALDGNAAFTLFSLPCSIFFPSEKYPLKQLFLSCCSSLTQCEPRTQVL